MVKPPKEQKSGKSDPTKDPEFQKVVRRFLKTPPKPHKPKKEEDDRSEKSDK